MAHKNTIPISFETFFDTSSKQKTKQEVVGFAKELQTQLSEVGIKIDVEAINRARNPINALAKQFQQFGLSISGAEGNLRVMAKNAEGLVRSISLQNLEGEWASASSDIVKYTDHLTQVKQNYQEIDSLQQKLTKLEGMGITDGEAVNKIKDSLAAYDEQMKQLADDITKTDGITAYYDETLRKMNVTGKTSEAQTMRALDYRRQENESYNETISVTNDYLKTLSSLNSAEEKLAYVQQSDGGNQQRIQAIQELIGFYQQELEKLKQKAQQLGILNQLEEKSTEQQKKHAVAMSDMTKNAQQQTSVLGNLKRVISQIVTYGMGYRILYKIVDAGKEMVNTVITLDKKLVDLQIVTGKTREETQALIKDYNQLAIQLGVTTETVANASDTWLRQGYSVKDANTLIKNSTMLATLGQVDSAEATQYLTSAMKGYKVSVEDSLNIVDKFTEVDRVAAVSAGGLAEAMSRTANSARLAGVDMDSLIGYLAAVGEVTQQDMSSIGNAWKTIFARFSNIKAGKFVDDATGEALNDVDKVLSKFNISLYDTQGNMRNVKEVLDEVAAGWANYTDVERNALATAVAGVRQKENFVTLMENYGNAVNYAITASDAFGTATTKYGYYLDGIEAKTNQFKATLEELALNTINSSFIKSIISVGNVILKMLNKPFGQWIIKTGLAVSSTTVLIKIMAKLLGVKGIAGLTKGIKTLGYGFTALSGNTAKAKAGIAALNTEMTAAEVKAEATTAATSALSVAIAGIVIAISAAIAIYNDYQQKQEETFEKNKEKIENLAQESKTVVDLAQQYKQLSQSENQDSNTRGQILDLQKQITEAVGGEAKGLDLVNGNLDDQYEKIVRNRAASYDTKNLKMQYKTALKAMGSSVAGWTEFFGWNQGAGLENVLTQLMNQGKIDWSNDTISYKLQTGTDFSDIEEFEKYIDELENLKQVILDNQEDISEDALGRGATEAYNYLGSIIDEYKKRLATAKQARDNLFEARAYEQFSKDLEKIDINSKEAFDNYISSIQNSKAYSQDFKDTLIDLVKQYFPEYIEEVKEAAVGSQEFTETLENLNKKASDLENAYSALSSAVEEYNKYGKFSIETLESLLSVEPQYLKLLFDKNGKIVENTALLRENLALIEQQIVLTQAYDYIQSFQGKTQDQVNELLGENNEFLEANNKGKLQILRTMVAQLNVDKKSKESIWGNVEVMFAIADATNLVNNNLEEQADAYDQVLAYVNKTISAQIKALEDQKKALEEKNDEAEREIELQELQNNLLKAQQRTMRTYVEGQGWIWVQDPAAVKEAEDALAEKNRDLEVDQLDKAIEALQKYLDMWTETKDNIDSMTTDAANEATALDMYGDDFVNKILNKDIDALDTFKNDYAAHLQELKKQVDIEVGSIKSSLASLGFEGFYDGKERTSKNFMGSTESTKSYLENQRRIKTFDGQAYLEINDGQWVKVGDTIGENIDGEQSYTVPAGTSIYGFATGTKNAQAGWANVDENGNELIINNPNHGRYTYLSDGSGVLPANLTQRIFDVAANPLKYISNALGSIIAPNVGNRTATSSKSITIGNITLPSVQNADDFVKQLEIMTRNR